MRLSGEIVNAALIHSVASSLEKFEKLMLLKFLPESIELILLSSLEEGMQIYSTIPTKKIFLNYLIETTESEGIFIEMLSENLTRSLKSSAENKTNFLICKKGETSYLKITTLHKHKTKNSIELSQDIPIRILNKDQMQLVSKPQIPKPDIQFKLPKIEILRTEVHRLKNTSSELTLSANLNRKVKIDINCDLAQYNLDFRIDDQLDYDHLPEEFLENSLKYQDRPIDRFSFIKVSMKDFVRCISAPMMNSKNTVCGILDNRVLIITCLLVSPLGESLGRITFCFPAHFQ